MEVGLRRDTRGHGGGKDGAVRPASATVVAVATVAMKSSREGRWEFTGATGSGGGPIWLLLVPSATTSDTNV
eukprot:5393359-Prymnesium_polylepis.1